MGWKVNFDKCEKQLMEDFEKGLIAVEDIRIIKVWRNTIEESGPEVLPEIKKWDDHPLHKEWEGYRSSSFSLRGRIIYKIVDEKIIVEVVKITPSHDYKKV